MRWSKIALLLFGAGLLLGLAAVIAELDALARAASLAMALGILALPAGAIADLWRAVRPLRPGRRRRKPGRPVGGGERGRRSRKRASPQR
jgi:hypothetical protein